MIHREARSRWIPLFFLNPMPILPCRMKARGAIPLKHSARCFRCSVRLVRTSGERPAAEASFRSCTTRLFRASSETSAA